MGPSCIRGCLSVYDMLWDMADFSTFKVCQSIKFDFNALVRSSWVSLKNHNRLIRTITAIPNPTVLPPSLIIQIRLRRMLALPFIKPRVIEVPPADLTLYERLYDQPMLGAGYAVEEDSVGRWSAPFRRFAAASRTVARSLSKIWTRGGFVKMRVRDRRGGLYKLDRDGGWALDEGRGIDRLIRVKAG